MGTGGVLGGGAFGTSMGGANKSFVGGNGFGPAGGGRGFGGGF